MVERSIHACYAHRWVRACNDFFQRRGKNEPTISFRETGRTGWSASKVRHRDRGFRDRRLRSDQLKKSAAEFHVPDNAIITPALKDSRVEVRVQFTRPITFPGYTYNYDFDYTARSTAFLTIK